MKKLLSFFFLSMLIFSCQKESNLNLIPEITPPPPNRITICHATNSESNPWVTLEINENAWPGHEAHGDINPDADGDTFTKINPCGIGDETDCDDENENVNPDAAEDCDDGIDNDCNGLVDCDDPGCAESDLCGSCCFDDDVLDEFEGEFAFAILELAFPGVTILWPQSRTSGILVAEPGSILGNQTYICQYSTPSGNNSTVEITAEEYQFCRDRILQLAEEAGIGNGEGEESIDQLNTININNVFGIK